MRYFVFLYIDDGKIGSLLNTAIAVLNPRAKWPAHITVSGPFSSRRKLPRRLEYRRPVVVYGVGQFRSDTQNTVFLRVGAEGLRDISFKEDYDFNPHITLYDGVDHQLGDALYQELEESFAFSSFYVSDLAHVEAGRDQRDMDFLLHHLDEELLGALNVTAGSFDEFSIEERVRLASRAVREALEVSRKFASANHSWWLEHASRVTAKVPKSSKAPALPARISRAQKRRGTSQPTRDPGTAKP